jgi:hypothetical protein
VARDAQELLLDQKILNNADGLGVCVCLGQSDRAADAFIKISDSFQSCAWHEARPSFLRERNALLLVEEARAWGVTCKARTGSGADADLL